MKQTHLCDHCGQTTWGWIGMVTCPECFNPFIAEFVVDPNTDAIPFDPFDDGWGLDLTSHNDALGLAAERAYEASLEEADISPNHERNLCAQMMDEGFERDEKAAFDRMTSADEVRAWAYRETGADEGLCFPDQADHVADCAVERWEDHRRAKAPKHPWFTGLTMLGTPALNQH